MAWSITLACDLIWAILQLRVFQQNTFQSGRSLNSSRKSEFGDSGHQRTRDGDASKIATDRLLSKSATVRYRPNRLVKLPNADAQRTVFPRLGPVHDLPNGKGFLGMCGLASSVRVV